jgi:hypothetical protein
MYFNTLVMCWFLVVTELLRHGRWLNDSSIRFVALFERRCWVVREDAFNVLSLASNSSRLRYRFTNIDEL